MERSAWTSIGWQAAIVTKKTSRQMQAMREEKARATSARELRAKHDAAKDNVVVGLRTGNWR